jgi:PTH2 family peptidyl-tRNA hydrolase
MGWNRNSGGDKMKQVIIVRKDLKMGCGKIAGQVAHASLRAFLKSSNDKALKYMASGEVKIVLKVRSKEELFNIYNKCISEEITVAMVRDAGRTQIDPHTPTAIGIGPDVEEKIDEIVGELKLL